MKLRLLAFTILAGIAIACSENSSESESTTNSLASASIEGMTCEVGCAKGIEKELNKTEGITEASVNFEEKTASIHFDNTKISEDEIEKIIEEMNEGQYEVELKHKKESSSVISSGSESDIEAHSFSFEVPNLFSVLKNVL